MNRIIYISVLFLLVVNITFSQEIGGSFDIPSSSKAAEVIPCEVYTSTAQIRNAMIAGALVQGCTYAAPFTYGTCLGETEVIFTAISPSNVSQDITLIRQGATYFGRWDLQLTSGSTGLLELKDQRGNEVEGRNAIGRFPWGSARVLNTHVENNATWTCDCEPAYNHYDNHHLQDSNLNTTGMAGYIYQSTFQGESRIVLSNSTNVAIDGSIFSGNNALGDLDGQTNIQILRSKIHSSTLDYNGGTEFIINNSIVTSSTVRNDNGKINLSQCTISGASNLTCSQGELDAIASSYETFTDINQNSTSRHYDFRCSYSTSARVDNLGSTTHLSYYSSVSNSVFENYNNTYVFDFMATYDSRAVVTYTDVTRVNTYYDQVGGLAIKTFISIPATCRSYANHISSRGQMLARNRNAGYAYFTYCNISAQSQITLDNGTINASVVSCNATGRSLQQYLNSSHFDNNTVANGHINATNIGVTSVRYSIVSGNYQVVPTTGLYSNKIKDAINDNW